MGDRGKGSIGGDRIGARHRRGLGNLSTCNALFLWHILMIHGSQRHAE